MGLEGLLQAARARVRTLSGRRGELLAAARSAPVPPVWRAAFEGAAVGLIGEIKRRSPSEGTLADEVDAARQARGYAEGGAVAVSVLTEDAHFGGSLEDLRAVAATVRVPVLRKDFVLDPLQVYEARVAGASAVLLIVRVLEDGQLAELSEAATEVGLGTLVEVHTRGELERALAVRPAVIGVNSRDLGTFKVDLRAVREVLRAVPREVIAVAESGVAGRSDVERLAGWGADAVLVGTHLMRQPDPVRAVRELVGVARVGR